MPRWWSRRKKGTPFLDGLMIGQQQQQQYFWSNQQQQQLMYDHHLLQHQPYHRAAASSAFCSKNKSVSNVPWISSTPSIANAPVTDPAWNCTRWAKTASSASGSTGSSHSTGPAMALAATMICLESVSVDLSLGKGTSSRG